MSKGGFGKRNGVHSKKGLRATSTNNSPDKHSLEDEDKLMVKFVFEGEKFHARTPICFDQLTLKDLLQKSNLDITLPPPTPRQLFETYFKEDVYPYIRHNIQSQIRNKRDITKLWDSQSQLLQKIYQNRAKILRDEWLNRREKNKNSKEKKMEHDEVTLRKKAELKAKNKANKQKWKQEIAMQIAKGDFDDNVIIKQHKNTSNKVKKPLKKEKKRKIKPQKKKKIKKWKDKKTKNMEELWPIITNNNNVNIKKPIKKKRLIYSQLRFKLIIRTQQTTYLIDDEMNTKQLDELIKSNHLILIKIWIYVENIKNILLNTDRDHVLLTLNQSKLFQILWIDFGSAIKDRVDTQHIDVVFVKKSKMLRLKIPILSL